MEKEPLLASLEARRGIYEFLAEIFLYPIAVPGHDFVDRVLDSATFAREDGSPDDSEDYRQGSRLLRNCRAAFVCGDRENLQKEIAVDRTRLCRGSSIKQSVPPPPYEALYLSPQFEAEHLLKVNAAYRNAGVKISGDTRERVDYIGLELAFMAELCARECAAVRQGDEAGRAEAAALAKGFLEEHLSLWVPEYCGLVIEKANTDFFRGIAHLLRGFLNEEQA